MIQINPGEMRKSPKIVSEQSPRELLGTLFGTIPLGVIILAAAWIVSGCLSFYWIFIRIRSSPSYLIPGIIVAIATFSMAAGSGLLRRKLWAYKANLIVHCVVLGIGLLGLAYALPSHILDEAVGCVLEVLWATVWLAYLKRPAIKTWFDAPSFD